jgi:hypothetical protein
MAWRGRLILPWNSVVAPQLEHWGGEIVSGIEVSSAAPPLNLSKLGSPASVPHRLNRQFILAIDTSDQSATAPHLDRNARE